MAGNACWICPGDSCMYIQNALDNEASPEYTTVMASAGTGFTELKALSYVKLPETRKITLDANRDEADKIRTSGTGGVKQKGCLDTITYQCTVTSLLCKTDWIYCYILDDPHSPHLGGKHARWFLVSVDGTDANSDTVVNWNKVLYAFRGIVLPSGVEIDIDGNNPLEIEWTAEASSPVILLGSCALGPGSGVPRVPSGVSY